MVVTRISDGLGNQLFQYAAGLALAKRLQTTLGFDTGLLRRDPSRRYELHRFNVTGSVIPHARKTLIRVSTSPRLRLLHGLLRTALPRLCYTHFRDRNTGYDPAFESLTGNIYLDGYWQSEKYFAGSEADLRREFTLREPPNEQNQEALQRIVAVPHAVCVHVRRGDYLSNLSYRAKYLVCDLNYYRNALRFLRTQVSNPSYFVFSDDPVWAQANLHIEGPTEYIAFNVGRQDYEDLRLMSACRHFIIANSTFSWWGAWLSTGNEQCVIAPQAWYVDLTKSIRDLIPNSWTLL